MAETFTPDVIPCHCTLCNWKGEGNECPAAGFAPEQMACPGCGERWTIEGLRTDEQLKRFYKDTPAERARESLSARRKEIRAAYQSIHQGAQ